MARGSLGDDDMYSGFSYINNEEYNASLEGGNRTWQKLGQSRPWRFKKNRRFNEANFISESRSTTV